MNTHLVNTKSGSLFFLFMLLMNVVLAQDSLVDKREPCIIFPSPMYDKNWQQSIGFVSTTTPEDITEEVQLRAPAGDWHVLRRLGSHFNADGILIFQIVQNQISVGIRYTTQLGRHTYIGVGDDQAFWFGKLKVGGFDTKGKGWTNFPHVSFGYRTNSDLLFTFKAEALFNMSYTFNNGGYEVSKDENFFNGYAFTYSLEQPFYNKKHLTLAFTAMYTDFFWQMWSLFETFDRKIFYPQITVGFII